MNARDELLDHIGNRDVKHVHIVYERYCNGSRIKDCFSGKLDSVLGELNFDYDSGYGSQELFGNIWYNDGTWSERGEYDGSEWWEHKSRPDIPAGE